MDRTKGAGVELDDGSRFYGLAKAVHKLFRFGCQYFAYVVNKIVTCLESPSQRLSLRLVDAAMAK